MFHKIILTDMELKILCDKGNLVLKGYISTDCECNAIDIHVSVKFKDRLGSILLNQCINDEKKQSAKVKRELLLFPREQIVKNKEK